MIELPSWLERGKLARLDAYQDMLAALKLAQEQLTIFAEFDRGNGGEDAELHEAYEAVNAAIIKAENP